MSSTIYQQMIKETLAKMGRVDAMKDAHVVEAWMRLEHGTLDALGGARWTRAVREAIECYDTASIEESEGLAKSYGLRPVAEPGSAKEA